MPDQILWTALSRFHDWTDRKFPARMFQHAVEAKVLGAVDWISVQEGPRREHRIDDLDHLGEHLFALATPHPKNGIISIDAGGNSPAPWTITALMPPYVKNDNRVWGYGVVSLLFQAADVGAELSATLIDAFMRTHTPNDTEYACIHWYERLQTLRDTLYKRPVTFTPMLAGVFWANFLGVGQLELFDTSRLRALQAYRTEWLDDRGFFLVVSPNLADAMRPDVENEMERLTKEFRAALK